MTLLTIYYNFILKLFFLLKRCSFFLFNFRYYQVFFFTKYDFIVETLRLFL